MRARRPTSWLITLSVVVCSSDRLEAAQHPLRGNRAEQALLQTLEQNKLIRAREQSEQILRHNSKSIIARYGLARALFEEEANLPRALFHMRWAEKQLLSRFGQRPSDPLAQQWHRRMLLGQEAILGEMDRREEQLAVLDRYDSLYKPKLETERVWPLLKLHRFEEVLRISRRLSRSTDASERISGYNGLLSVEFERERPAESYRVARQALEATGNSSCVLNHNAAETAFAMFKFSEAERFAQRSIQAPRRDCPTPAHPHLANLYLLRGDFQQAISAVKAARETKIEARHRQQFETGIRVWLMRLLYALGEFDKALELARFAVRAPDRVGLTSFSAEVMDLIHKVDHYSAMVARIEQLRERASARPLSGRIAIAAQIKQLQIAAWTARRSAAKLLARADNLRLLVRPYLKPFPAWRTSALIPVVGLGVFDEAIARARMRETRPQATVYYDAWAAEVEYRRGRYAGALARVATLEKRLPRDELLMRSHVMAWAADAAMRVGRTQLAQNYFDSALGGWPTALRALGIAVPVKVVAGNSQLENTVGRLLERSTRLTRGALGFVVSVRQHGKSLRTCLSGPGGRRYACEQIAIAKKSIAEIATAAVDSFHDTVFAPKVDLTQQDINSLDGSAVRGGARDLLRDLFGK